MNISSYSFLSTPIPPLFSLFYRFKKKPKPWNTHKTYPRYLAISPWIKKGANYFFKRQDDLSINNWFSSGKPENIPLWKVDDKKCFLQQYHKPRIHHFKDNEYYYWIYRFENVYKTMISYVGFYVISIDSQFYTALDYEEMIEKLRYCRKHGYISEPYIQRLGKENEEGTLESWSLLEEVNVPSDLVHFSDFDYSYIIEDNPFKFDPSIPLTEQQKEILTNVQDHEIIDLRPLNKTNT